MGSKPLRAIRINYEVDSKGTFTVTIFTQEDGSDTWQVWESRQYDSGEMVHLSRWLSTLKDTAFLVNPEIQILEQVRFET